MGHVKLPQPVKLVVSAFAPHGGLLQESCAALEAEWGPVDFESELLPFEHTSYYTPEFGPGLVRRIWTFRPLIDPGTLAAKKLRSNELEQRWTVAGRRQVDLDPGYVSAAKLVLATTKNHGHRIYLQGGIYAEVTLQYRDGAFRPWPWTYPDYATAAYCELFAGIRQRYMAQVRQIGKESEDERFGRV